MNHDSDNVSAALGRNAHNYARINGARRTGIMSRLPAFIIAAMVGVLIALAIGTIATKAMTLANAEALSAQNGGAW